MNPDPLTIAIQIAEIHAERLHSMYTDLANLFPVKAENIITLNKQEILLCDGLVYRFGHLQDHVGAKLIGALLNAAGVPADNMTPIDKMNQLEKFHAIDSAYEWKDLRELRNHLSHEYVLEPAINAKYLNQAYEATPRLLAIVRKLIEFGRGLPR